MALIQCVKQPTNSFHFSCLYITTPFYSDLLIDFCSLNPASILLLAAFGDCLTDRLLRFSLIYLHPIDVPIVALAVGHSVRVLGPWKRRGWRLRLANRNHGVRGRALQRMLVSVALWLSQHANSRNSR